MKLTVVSDLVNNRLVIITTAILGLIYGVGAAIVSGSFTFTCGLVFAFCTLMPLFNIFAADEQSDWHQYRMALPTSRTGVVVGRYLSIALFGFISLVLALICALAGVGVVRLLDHFNAQIPGLRITLTGFEEVFEFTMIVVAVGVVFMAIILPILFRLGNMKALPFVILVGVVMAFGTTLIAYLCNEVWNNTRFVLWFCDLISDLSIGAIAGIVSAVAIVLYVASAAISVKAYAKRDL